MRIVKFLKNLDMLMNGVTQTNNNKMKEWSGAFLDTLGANILDNMITGKEVIEQEIEYAELQKISNSTSSFH